MSTRKTPRSWKSNSQVATAPWISVTTITLHSQHWVQYSVSSWRKCARRRNRKSNASSFKINIKTKLIESLGKASSKGLPQGETNKFNQLVLLNLPKIKSSKLFSTTPRISKNSLNRKQLVNWQILVWILGRTPTSSSNQFHLKCRRFCSRLTWFPTCQRQILSKIQNQGRRATPVDTWKWTRSCRWWLEAPSQVWSISLTIFPVLRKWWRKLLMTTRRNTRI